jgi:hypothetical protein
MQAREGLSQRQALALEAATARAVLALCVPASQSASSSSSSSSRNISCNSCVSAAAAAADVSAALQQWWLRRSCSGGGVEALSADHLLLPHALGCVLQASFKVSSSICHRLWCSWYCSTHSWNFNDRATQVLH